MDDLRLILIAAGILLLLAIYLWDRYRHPRPPVRTLTPDFPPDGDREEAPVVVITSQTRYDERMTDELVDEEDAFRIPPDEDDEDIAVALAPDQEDEPLPSMRPAEQMEVDIDLFDAKQAPPDRRRQVYAPDLFDMPAEPEPAPEVAGQEDLMSMPTHETEPAAERILILHLLARRPEGITGPALQQAAREAGFRFGDMNIFHYSGEQHKLAGKMHCSLVNMYEPGHFDPDTFATFSTRGLSLFTTVQTGAGADRIFLAMLDITRQLAARLNADILGSERQPLDHRYVEAVIGELIGH